MIVRTIVIGILFTLPGFLPGMSVATAQAQTPQGMLNQYISDLQKNPNDYALREKIIKHVQTMKPAPGVPPAVIKHEGAAEYAFKNAKNESDFLDSANEYEKALLIAPWLAIDYFNCGVAYEKAGQFKKAIAQFNLYLLAAPDAQDSNAVLKRIGGLEYAAGKAGKKPATTAKKQNDYEDWLKKLDGVLYVYRQGAWTHTLRIRGREVVEVDILGPNDLDEPGPRNRGTATIEDRRFIKPGKHSSNAGRSFSWTCRISEDGSSISCDGDGRTMVYHRER